MPRVKSLVNKVAEKIKLNAPAIKAGIKLAKLLAIAIADRKITRREAIEIKIAGEEFWRYFDPSDSVAEAAEKHEADNA